MTTIFAPIREFFKKGDLLLLFLCLLASGYGLVLIYSATRTHASGPLRFVAVQGVAICIGVGIYFLLTLVDFQLFTARTWKLLVLFDIGFILLLRTPLGTDHGSGNLNWLSIPGFPLDIQPNEVVKIPFILLRTACFWPIRLTASNGTNGISAPCPPCSRWGGTPCSWWASLPPYAATWAPAWCTCAFSSC